MSIASLFGMGKKVRYAVVGLGDIAQEAFLPGIAHTGNSELVALVTGDPKKAGAVGERYGITATYDYSQFGELIRSGTIDAIYLATPNFRHAEFAVPALEAGISVLCEKPLEVSVEQAMPILDAENRSSAKLMTAYRLHFEPATLAAIRRIRDGELGDLVMFTSAFGQKLDPANHRAKHGVAAGPLLDMGAYPINASRYLFGEEPVEVVSAVSVRSPTSDLGDIDDTVAVTLRFPGDRLAQFTVSYFANAIDSFVVAGTKGSIHMTPAFGFNKPKEQHVTIGDKERTDRFKAVDEFGGQLRYFSDCILNNRHPEPDAAEGIADLRVMDAILKAIESKGPVAIHPDQRPSRIDPDKQEQKLAPVSPPKPADAAKPTR